MKIVKINNNLKNKGIIFPDNMTFMDLLQSWNYLTRFMLDVLENKASYRLDEITKLKAKAEFKAFLKYWHEYAEKTIPDDVKITIKELDEE